MPRLIGIVRYLIKDINQLSSMNYALGYAFNIHDMFAGFDTGKLDLDSKTCEEVIGNRHKEAIAKKVFKYAIKLALDDIINNNIRLELPTMGKTAYLGMKRVSGEDFSKARRNGKWRDIDFLASNFTGYNLVLNYKNQEIQREKKVYVDPINKSKITANTNNGMQYY